MSILEQGSRIHGRLSHDERRRLIRYLHHDFGPSTVYDTVDPVNGDRRIALGLDPSSHLDAREAASVMEYEARRRGEDVLELAAKGRPA